VGGGPNADSVKNGKLAEPFKETLVVGKRILTSSAVIATEPGTQAFKPLEHGAVGLWPRHHYLFRSSAPPLGTI